MLAAVIIAGFVAVLLVSSVKRVRPGQVAIVERLGKYSRTLDPGVHLLVLLVDAVKATVDVGEQAGRIDHRSRVERFRTDVDIVIRYTVTDPVRATYQVAHLETAITALVDTTLEHGTIADLRIVLDEATAAWGVRIDEVEVTELP